MNFDIQHSLHYEYDRPVFLEPFIIRLRPRCDATQTLIAYSLTCDPEPTVFHEGTDAYGNNITVATFDGKHEHLTIKAGTRISTLLEDPFNYIITDRNALTLPMSYSQSEAAALVPFLQRKATIKAVEKLACHIKEKAGANTSNFLSELADYIHDNHTQLVREQGNPWSSEVTLRRGEGACRDFTILFIDACRAMGLAARFVSGYGYTPESDAPDHLHAWAEVYLPGAGWRGYDPTLGLATADHHIPLASGIDENGAAPTTGSFRGTKAHSEFNFSLKIDVLPDQDTKDIFPQALLTP
jgi:transglutaminase-like putative cysteine protease